jgi:predicted ATPase/class 3 adenylate cyclase
MVNFGTERTDAQSLGAERRQVTVLSCELVSETDADPEDVSSQLERYRADVVQRVTYHGGLIVGDIGGSILAVWGSSSGSSSRRDLGAFQGQSPRAALMAALDLTAQRYRSARIKIAVDAGIVIVNHCVGSGKIGDLVGRVLVDANTFRAQSDNSTVVVSNAVRHLAAESFIFAPLDIPQSRAGTGLTQGWRVIACKGHLQPPDRRAPRLVGNHRQRTSLDQALAAVQALARQIVIVTGEAGIGKSALFRHFRARVIANKARWIEATCRPEQSHATLQPIRDLLRQALPKTDIDWLAQTTSDHIPTIPTFIDLDAADRQLLSRFFDVKLQATPPFSTTRAQNAEQQASNLQRWPSNRQQRLITLLIEIIGHIATVRPTFFALEDLHWADGATLEFLALLVDRSTRWRQFGLLLVTRRHDNLPIGVIQRATAVAVDRLSTNEIVELLIGTEALPLSTQLLAPDILRLIAHRSEGVPLFAEQLAALYLNTVDPERASAILATPTSLNLTLAARLDALGQHKSLAQSAAVLGRDFDEGVLCRMLAIPAAQVRNGLAVLIASGLVMPVTDRLHVSHRFSHALVRDAAYASLLRQRRRLLHAQPADTITLHFAALAETNPEAMALHYAEAGASRTAAKWWRVAAEGALSLSQLDIAVSHLQRGLTLLAMRDDPQDPAPEIERLAGPQPDEELAIRRLLGPCLTMLAGNGADAVIDNYRRCRELTAGLATTPFEILWGLQGCHSVRGELDDALEIGQQAIIVAEASAANRSEGGDEQCLLAHRMQGLSRLQAGDIAQAISHYAEVHRRYDPTRHEAMRFRYASDQGALALAHWAWAEAVAGHSLASEQLAEQALARADHLAHPHTSAHVLSVLAARAQTLQQREIASTLAIAARTLANTHNFTYWSAWAEIILGWHEAAYSPENSIIRIERAIQDYRRTGAGQALPYALLLKAGVALDAGLYDLAERTTIEGLKLARVGGLGLYLSELLRVRALALMQTAAKPTDLSQPAAPAVESGTRAARLALEEAMATSLRQGTRIFTMRSAVAYLQAAPPDHATADDTPARQRAATALRHVLDDMTLATTPKKHQRSPEITAAWALMTTFDG